VAGLDIDWTLSLDDGKVAAHFEAHSDEAATLMGEHVGQVADQTAPIEEGTLIRSRFVTEPEDGVRSRTCWLRSPPVS